MQSYKNIKLRWTIELNIEARFIKLLAENTGMCIFMIQREERFLKSKQKALTIKGKNDNLDFIKNNFLLIRGTFESEQSIHRLGKQSQYNLKKEIIAPIYS